MPTSTHPADKIVGRGLITAETIAHELRQKITARAKGLPGFMWQQGFLGEVQSLLSEYEAIFAEAIANTDKAAWLAGFHQVAKSLPEWAKQTIGGGIFQPPRPPFRGLVAPSSDDGGIVRFPLIERAAESMLDRGILSPGEYQQADQAIRNKSFSVASDMTADTLATVRDSIAEAIKEGDSYITWQNKIADRIDTSRIGPGHLENVFRTNVMTAYSDGGEQLSAHPIVAEMFPYRMYVSTHDARARKTHLALEHLGIDGTNVYRSDDPFWNLFLPPWDYQCRCDKINITLRRAAELGIKEAIEWLNTGVKPPLVSMLPKIEFRPREGWGGRSLTAA